MNEQTRPPSTPVQDNRLCSDGKLHVFERAVAKDSKTKEERKTRKCKKCGREEYNTEVCEHCKFFVPNSPFGLIPQAGLTDQGYCSRHRTLYAKLQPACVLFARFISTWRHLLGEKSDDEEETDNWKKKPIKINGNREGDVNGEKGKSSEGSNPAKSG